MAFPVDGSLIRVLPRKFFNKHGQLFRLELLAEEARERLLAMYLAFQPRNCFQGLPPIRDEVCIPWVRGMIATGVNLMAESVAGEVVGHAALFPINPRKCEMLVVVSPEHQNVGIGTELVRGCVTVAAELLFERIWLPVEARNMRARRVYEKCGFTYASPPGRELDMVCQLKRPAVRPPHAPLRSEDCRFSAAEDLSFSNE
ncbi:MAG: GNAT family N-acetyltransferase [Pirellulales bacterium]|nr:GNAT family N-acetyltransferase [Pirellulales bacterium]